MKAKIFVTRKLPQGAMDRLDELFTVTCNPHDRVLTKEEILEGVRGCDALLCLLTDPIDGDIMDASPQLKVLSNYAVGYNNIDMEAAQERQLPVCFTPGVLTESTADLNWALLLAAARHVVPSERFTRQGKFKGWGPELFLGHEIHGKTLGIIGMGRIGAAVARRGLGFGMKILFTKRTPLEDPSEVPGAQKVEFDELLQKSDFISIHVPMSPATRHLIGKQEFVKMKSNAILINTARGPIVDEAAMVEALKNKVIAAAGLDVYEEEPKINPGLLELDNAVLLPHTGSATLQTRTKMGTMAAENAHAVLEGRAPHAIVNPEVLGNRFEINS